MMTRSLSTRTGKLAVLTLLSLSSACMQAPKPDVVSSTPKCPDPVAVKRATSLAAEKVKACYSGPRLGRSARQIVTVVHVRYLQDGTLADEPEIVRQYGVTDDNQAFAGPMARAAIEAVKRCSPLSLPSELYSRGWDDFELTFSPRGMA